MAEYVCVECGCQFDQPKRCVEKHGLDTPPYEIYDCCPECGGTYIDVIYCDSCGDPIVGDYIVLKSGEQYCDNCFTHRNNIEL